MIAVNEEAVRQYIGCHMKRPASSMTSKTLVGDIANPFTMINLCWEHFRSGDDEPVVTTEMARTFTIESLTEWLLKK